MAEILFHPGGENTVSHDCDDEMPGKPLKVDNKYHPTMVHGTVIECSCGKIYRAHYSGYPNLGCSIKEVGFWEARRYRKGRVSA